MSMTQEAPRNDATAALPLDHCSASLPADEWLDILISQLGKSLSGIGDTVSVPRELVAHTQSALISQLGAWRDCARLNWLDERGALWVVRLNGVETTPCRIRDAINTAILRVERGPNTETSQPRGQTHE